PSALIIDGRKEFNGSRSKPHFTNYDLRGKREVPLDEWISAETAQQIRASDGVNYESGFHVYEGDTRELNKSPYRRVFVRFVTARGDGGRDRKVVIAREMFVPIDENGWPPKDGSTPKKQSTLDRIKGAIKPGNA